MDKKKDQEYAARMELITNKAAQHIVHYLTSHVDHSMASIVSLIKASAIILEASKEAGENDEFLESLIFDMIKPARKEARRLLLQINKEKDAN